MGMLGFAYPTGFTQNSKLKTKNSKFSQFFHNCFCLMDKRA